jgi:lysophospholipase L1-like esterase
MTLSSRKMPISSGFPRLGIVTPPGPRTVVFVVSLFLLFAFARAGTSNILLLILFVLYVVAATLWVRGQYAESMHNDKVSPWPVGAGIGIIGLVMVLASAISRINLVLAGLTLVYFGAGLMLSFWRRRRHHRRLVGGVLLGLGLGSVVVGSVLLGRFNATLEGVILLTTGLLLFLPVATALLSEEAFEWLDHRGGAYGTCIVVVSSTGFVLVALAVGFWLRTPWAAGAVLALGLIVAAIVSSTQADIAGVLAVLAILGVTQAPASDIGQLDPGGRSHVLVALGDSYMSGEGAAIYYEGTDEGGGDTCHRSPTAWAAMLGQEQHYFGGLAFLACSGARSTSVLEDGKAQKGEPGTQLAQYRALQARRRFTPSLVVLTLGGNDAGFSTIGLTCVAPGDCTNEKDIWFDGLNQVEQSLRHVYAQVRQQFPHTPVVVAAYPDPIDNQPAAQRCSQVTLTRAERLFVSDFLHHLNARIKSAAAAYGFYYLESMQSALAESHLQLCDPLNDGRPGLNFIGLRSVNGSLEERFNPANFAHNSLHPNAQGHAAMLRVMQNWLATAWPLPPDAPKSLAGKSSVGPVRLPGASPPCDLFDVSPKGCRPIANRWAARQVGDVILSKGLIALLGASLAWAASVALLRRRQRHGR